MITTRKLPVRVDEKKRKTFAKDFLIPRFSDDGLEDGFVSIKNGRTFLQGGMVYLGMDVSPEMILDRYCENLPPPTDPAEALRRLTIFMDMLQEYKIGYLISITYAPDGTPELHLEERIFLPRERRNLP